MTMLHGTSFAPSGSGSTSHTLTLSSTVPSNSPQSTGKRRVIVSLRMIGTSCNAILRCSKTLSPASTFQLTRYIWIAVLTSVITMRPTAVIFVSSHRRRLKIRATDASLDKRSRVPVCPTPHFFTHKLKIYEASSGIRWRLWTHCLSAHRACWEL